MSSDGFYEHGVSPSVSTKRGQFLYKPLDFSLLEYDCTPCSAWHRAKSTADLLRKNYSYKDSNDSFFLQRS
jgi:hypothetical protein